jgi:hypothetical protein
MLKILAKQYNTDVEELMLTKPNSLRITVGLLGILLPVLLWLFTSTYCHYYGFIPSISHYYFTRACGVFEIVVGVLAIFLLIYKGDKPIDFWLSTGAGVCALIMLLYPTNNLCNLEGGIYNSVTVTKLIDNKFREGAHLATAGIFLGCLACMSLFVFTRPNKKLAIQTLQKKKRNFVYIFCGIVMVLALLTVLIFHIFFENNQWYTNNHMTYWMEVVAVEFFGISWMVKGKVFFKDVI